MTQLAKVPVKLLEQTFLKPGKYRVGDTLRDYDADSLRDYRDGTTAILAAGHSIPLFYNHKPLGSTDGGPVADPAKATEDTIGWLRGIEQQADGALKATIEVTDPKAEEKISNGSIRFTSPELSPFYVDGHGRRFENVVRHMSLTSVPRTPDQGQFTDPDDVQFSLDDYEGPIEMPKGKNKSVAEREIANMITLSTDTPFVGGVAGGGKSPALLTTAAQFADDEKKIAEEGSDTADNEGPDASSVMSQVIERLGVELPDGIDPMAGAGLVIVLTAILNKVGPAEAAEQVEEVMPGVAQFSEHTDPLVRALAERVMSLEETGHEAMVTNARAKLHARISTSKLPPVTKRRLMSLYSGAQFSEGQQTPQYTLAQVIEIVTDSIPKGIQFDENDVTEDDATDHPDGKQYLDGGKATEGERAAEAEAIYQEGQKGRWKGNRPQTYQAPPGNGSLRQPEAAGAAS